MNFYVHILVVAMRRVLFARGNETPRFVQPGSGPRPQHLNSFNGFQSLLSLDAVALDHPLGQADSQQ